MPAGHACLGSTGLHASAPIPPALELPSQLSVQQPQALHLTRWSLLVPPQAWRASSQMYLVLLLVGKPQGQVLMATGTPVSPVLCDRLPQWPALSGGHGS